MRLKHTINNVLYGLGGTIVITVLSFISRTVFVNKLGADYLGVNGLIQSVISMLSLTELGIGTAITFSLYKPLAENNINKIIPIMNFYKKTYKIIGCLVFGFGIILMFFLKYLIKDSEKIDHLYIIYLIFLINTSYTYFFSYKRTLINADQKAYRLIPFTTTFKIVLTVLQVIVLIAFKNYIIYLIMQFIVGLVENYLINKYIDKKYSYIKKNLNLKIPREELNIIGKNIKAMFLHKIGDYAINGTDNIIISSFINITSVGLYSNYLLLINTANKFLLIIFKGAGASFGNLLAQETEDIALEKFEIFNFLGFWIYGWVSICFFNLLNPFITIWLGSSYILNKVTVSLIITNFYLVGMRVPIGIVKTSAGVYSQDRFLPLIQAGINLCLSVILVNYFGLNGVFMGTLISSLSTVCWYRPIVVYKYVFKKSPKKYFVKYLYYLVIVIISMFITRFLCDLIFFNNTILNLLGKILICFFTPNLIFILIFRKTVEYKYLRKTIKNFSARLLNGKK